MKKILTLIVLLCATSMYAQKIIAVKGPTTDAIVKTLNEAVEIAKPNDKIYLPGGIFTFTDTLNKPVHIIGTGYDSSVQKADGISMVNTNGKFVISDGAAGTILEGCLFREIALAKNVDNLTFKRIQVYTYLNNSSSIRATNSTVIECMIRYLYNFDDSYIHNSVFENVYYCDRSLLKACVIWYYRSNSSLLVQDSVIGYPYSCSNCQWVNVKYTGNNSSSTFYSYFKKVSSANPSIHHDYHLKDTVTEEVGIYYGDYPWKENAHPFAPLILENNSYLDTQSEQFKLRVKVLPQTH